MPPHRIEPTGGQCPSCRRLFVTDERVRHDTFSPGFLAERIAEISRGGELRFTSLQLQYLVRQHRPYPRQPRRTLRERLRARSGAGGSRGVRGLAGVALYFLAVAGLVTALNAAYTTYVEPWSAGRWWETPVAAAVGLLAVALFGVPVFFLAPARRVASFVAVLAGEVGWWATKPWRFRLGRMMRPSRFTAHVIATWAREHGGTPPGLVVAHGMVPPPPPEQVRLAVLCPEPAAAACLWANDVAGLLGALVVTAADDLPDGVPAIELRDVSPSDDPAPLLGRLLRESQELLDRGSTGSGFLSWPVST